MHTTALSDQCLEMTSCEWELIGPRKDSPPSNIATESLITEMTSPMNLQQQLKLIACFSKWK